MRPFQSAEVAQVFAGYPVRIQRKLLTLRALIFATAASTEGVGELEETLKWGEPSYLTTRSKSGTAVRLGWKKDHPARYAMYFHCQTNLVETFRAWFSHELEFEGNRAIVFDAGNAVPRDSLAACIAAALSYHRNKAKRRAKPRTR